MKNKPNIVVIGGGTGTFVTLSGLKYLDINLSAIVTVADSGGSTGRLRDEFGFLPVGDLRQALAALAHNGDQTWIRDLLLYRFSKGSGLEGHNLGNLILTALQDMTGSTAKATEITSSIFRLNGHIYPITTTSIQLVIEYESGAIETGEHMLDELKHGGETIVSLTTKPEASIYVKAKEAILAADLIVIGPGDLYGSILPNLIVKGASEALKHSHAKLVYVQNLMTRYTQTHNMTAQDHLNIINKHTGRPADVVIVNTAEIPQVLTDAYAKQHEFQVIDDLPQSPQLYQVIRAPLIKPKKVTTVAGDSLPRSYLRHDSGKLVAAIKTLLPELT